jgi:hypothetical protein
MATRKAAATPAEAMMADRKAAKLKKQAEELKKANPAAAKKADLPDGKAPKYKAPKTLGQAADELYEVRAERLSLGKTVAEHQAHETFLKEHIIENLPKSNATGVAGKLCRVAVTTRDVPQVRDWSKLYAHIVATYLDHKKRKTGQEDAAFAYLNRALSASAVEEQWEAKKAVPGVESFKALSVSINKV